MTAAYSGKNIGQYLQPGKRAHLVGIGGVSMRPLGLVLRSMGMEISGSDMNASVAAEELIANGITVHIGHSADNITGADCVIRTAAAHNDNPEIAAARAAGIPIFERAQAWGYIMRAYKNAICVAGTHGKTTTTSMLTHIFIEAQRDPTVMIGGYLPLLHACHRVGKGDTIILESCEYCNSFLNFYPTTAVILDVDADHLDFFKDLSDVEHSFREFAELVPQGGLVVANGDDANTVETLRGVDYVSFGFREENRVHWANASEDFRTFDVICDGKPYCHVSLGVRGRHNAMNALAAAAVAKGRCMRSLAPDGVWNTRAATTARISTTTTRTIRASCTRCWRPSRRWATGASCARSSRIPTRAPRRSSTTSCRSCAAWTWPF